MHFTLINIFKNTSQNIIEPGSAQNSIAKSLISYSAHNTKVIENISRKQTHIKPNNYNLKVCKTPSLVKMSINSRVQSKCQSEERSFNSNNEYVKNNKIVKNKTKRIKTQPIENDCKKQQQKSEYLGSKAIQLKNQSPIKSRKKFHFNIKNRKPQSSNKIKAQVMKEKDGSILDNQCCQDQDLIKNQTKKYIKLNKTNKDKFYNKILQNKVTKRQQSIKQTNFRQQIKSFNELETLKKRFNQKMKSFVSPPQISAKSYLVAQVFGNSYECQKKNSKNMSKNNSFQSLNHQNFKILASYNCNVQHQVASLTKIMTCILIIQICQKYRIPIKQSQFQISKFQSQIQGTSSKVKNGQVYTVQQLLYGLMLPSGNDASLALAVWAGNILLTEKFQLQTCIQINHKRKQCLRRFVDQMNKKSNILGMQKSKYSNPHGLNCLQNKSCCLDMVKLTNYCMKNSKFQQIVQSKNYTGYARCTVKVFQKEQEDLQIQYNKIGSSQSTIDQKLQNQSQSLNVLKGLKGLKSQNIQQNEEISQTITLKHKYRLIYWENTHKLLNLNSNIYKGVKTGITSQAGACLSSYLQFKGRQFIIVVLNCRSAAHRFKETQILRKYIFKQQGLCVCDNRSNKTFEKFGQHSSCCDFEQQTQQIPQTKIYSQKQISGQILKQNGNH